MPSEQQDNRVFSKDYGKNAHCQTHFNEKREVFNKLCQTEKITLKLI